MRASVLAAILAVAWFATLGAYRLFNPDEGRYAEIPREMMLSGDWVTPRFNDIKYFEKPPLQYWATAAAYELFGTAEWTARLWPAVTGFLGVMLTAWLAFRLYGPRVAMAAAAVQAGSLLYAFLGHFATLDMGLCFSLQLAMTGLALLADEQAQATRDMTAASLLAVGAAMAFLSKGLVGLLIPATVALIYMVVSREWTLLSRARPWWSIAALALLALPWIVTVSLRNPEFAQFFFVHEQFARYLTRVHDRYQSGAFFIPILIVGFLPWTALLPDLVAHVRRSWRDGSVRILTIWALLVFVFFSSSQSKLIPYILPMFPALALLTGRLLTTMEPRRVGRRLVVATIALLLIAFGAALAWNLPAYATWMENAVGGATTGLIAAAVLMAAIATVAAALAFRGSVVQAACAAALASLVFTNLSLLSGQRMPKMAQVTEMLEGVRQHANAETVVYCIGDIHESVLFYLRRSCTLVAYRGEFDMGLRQEPWRGIPDLEQFAKRWNEQPGNAIAIMRPSAYHRLRAMGVRMRTLDAGSTLLAVTYESDHQIRVSTATTAR